MKGTGTVKFRTLTGTKVLRPFVVVLDQPGQPGGVFRLDDDADVHHGQQVDVEFSPDDQFAHIVDSDERFDNALAAFARAAVELHRAWKPSRGESKGYPSHWEDFDEEVLHITEWARAAGVRS